MWYQVERIYCSIERCRSCPHGDFEYRYQRNKNGRVSKKYVRIMAVNNETIEWMRAGVRPGIPYVLEDIPDDDKAS